MYGVSACGHWQMCSWTTIELKSLCYQDQYSPILLLKVWHCGKRFYAKLSAFILFSCRQLSKLNDWEEMTAAAGIAFISMFAIIMVVATSVVLACVCISLFCYKLKRTGGLQSSAVMSPTSKRELYPSYKPESSLTCDAGSLSTHAPASSVLFTDPPPSYDDVVWCQFNQASLEWSKFIKSSLTQHSDWILSTLFCVMFIL